MFASIPPPLAPSNPWLQTTFFPRIPKFAHATCIYWHMYQALYSVPWNKMNKMWALSLRHWPFRDTYGRACTDGERDTGSKGGRISRAAWGVGEGFLSWLLGTEYGAKSWRERRDRRHTWQKGGLVQRHKTGPILKDRGQECVESPREGAQRSRLVPEQRGPEGWDKDWNFILKATGRYQDFLWEWPGECHW